MAENRERLVFKIPELPLGFGRHDLQNANFYAFIPTLGNVELEGKIERVSILKSQRELNEKKSEYRRLYNSIPEVRDRLREKTGSDEFKKKRQEYSSRPDVQARKKLTSAVKRQALNLVREKDPAQYERLMYESRKRKLQEEQWSDFAEDGDNTCKKKVRLEFNQHDSNDDITGELVHWEHSDSTEQH